MLSIRKVKIRLLVINFLFIWSACGILILKTNVVFAQSYYTQWQKTIGGSNGDGVGDIKETSDGGFICGGNSDSDISGDKTENSQGGSDFWVLKLNDLGEIQWQKTIGGNDFDRLQSINETSDEGFICGGYSASNLSGDKTENSNGYEDMWIVKLSNGGEIQWQNTIGGNLRDICYMIKQTFDGGYVLCGSTESGISGDKIEENVGNLGDADCWVIKLNEIGEIVWQNVIGGSLDDYFSYIQQTVDSGYICVGRSQSVVSGDKTAPKVGGYDIWIVRLNKQGDVLWDKVIGGSAHELGMICSEVQGGGMICGAKSHSGVSGDKSEPLIGVNDYWVMELDSLGQIIWQNTIGGDHEDIFSYASAMGEKRFISAGSSYSGISGDKIEGVLGDTLTTDYWVQVLDSMGNIQWQETIGGDQHDFLARAFETEDHGILLAGYSNSNAFADKSEDSHGGFDIWLVKMGEDIPTKHESLIQASFEKEVYPNPCKEYFFLNLEDLPGTYFTLEVFNNMGVLVHKQKVFENENQMVRVDHFNRGLYHYRVNTIGDSTLLNGKVIVH